MAYTSKNHVSISVGLGGVANVWGYKVPEGDTLAEVLAPDYFLTNQSIYRVDDKIYITKGAESEDLRVTEVEPQVKTIAFHGATNKLDGFTLVPISFEAPLFTPIIFYNFKVEIRGLTLFVTKQIAANDNANIALHVGITSLLPLPPHIVIPPLSPPGTVILTDPWLEFFTGNNVLVAGFPLEITPTKVTPGGEVFLQIYHTRVA